MQRHKVQLFRGRGGRAKGDGCPWLPHVRFCNCFVAVAVPSLAAANVVALFGGYRFLFSLHSFMQHTHVSVCVCVLCVRVCAIVCYIFAINENV